MLSPRYQYPLEQFDGAPLELRRTAQQFVDLGTTMASTADALADVADSDVHRSMGTDALAEQAEEVVGDLRKAAIRYAGTGNALLPYAEELLSARDWYRTNAEDVRAAETAYQQALVERDQALMSPDVEAQGDAIGDAESAVQSTEGPRDSLWTQWEVVVDDWSTAYEAAADAVAAAMDEADNDDGRWQWLSDALTILGYVILVVAVVALFVASSPLGWIVFGLSALHFVGTLYMYANGKKSLSDVIWSGVGLATAGFGVFGRGASAASALPAMDDVAAQTASQVGPRMAARVGNSIPGFPSLANLPTSMAFGSNAGRFATFADDLVHMGRVNQAIAQSGSGAQGAVQAMGSIGPGVANWFTGMAVGYGSNQPWFPSFGRP